MDERPAEDYKPVDVPESEKPSRFWDGQEKPLLIYAGFFSTGLLVFFIQQAVSRLMLQPMRSAWGLPLLLALPWLIAIILCLYAWIGVWRRHRAQPLLLVAALLLTADILGYLPVVGIMVTTQDYVWQVSFARIRKNAQPIISALAAFQRDHGHAPKELNELVPEYLKTIPVTGIKDYPTYYYNDLGLWGIKDHQDNKDNDSDSRRQRGWHLAVSCSRGMMDFSQYIYCSDPNDQLFRNPEARERTGQWVYLRD